MTDMTIIDRLTKFLGELKQAHESGREMWINHYG